MKHRASKERVHQLQRTTEVEEEMVGKEMAPPPFQLTAATVDPPPEGNSGTTPPPANPINSLGDGGQPAQEEDNDLDLIQFTRDATAPLQLAEKEPEGGESAGPTLEAPEVVFAQIPEEAILQRSSQELVLELSPLLQTYMEEVNYNSLEDGVNMAKHLYTTSTTMGSEASVQDRFNAYESDSLSGLENASGMQCVGQGIHFASIVNSRLGGQFAFVAAGQFGGRDTYSHGAAMLRFSNPENDEDSGYIILDPGFNVATPIVVTASQSAAVRKFTYSLNEEGTAIESRDEQGGLVVSFPTSMVVNPEAISKTFLMSARKFTVVSRASKKRTFLVVDLDSGTFELTVKGKKRGNFDLAEREAIEGIVTEDVATEMGYEHAELLSSIAMITDFKSELETLRN